MASIDVAEGSSWRRALQIEFTSEQEMRLSELAGAQGEATLRLWRDHAGFLAAVEEGTATADRGEFGDPSEVWARVEAILGR